MRAAAPRTAPDTVRLHSGSRSPILESRAALLAALLFAACWMLFLFGVQRARAQDSETVLPESGIHYPGGFDPNTVGEVQGKAYGFFQPEAGPVRFQLKSERDTYVVLASPAWYWKDLGAEISDGMELRVRGSKSLGRDGNLYVIAQEIQFPNGASLVLRNENGRPLWKGPKTGTRGRSGSSPRGMGGMRGAGSGMRRRGR